MSRSGGVFSAALWIGLAACGGGTPARPSPDGAVAVDGRAADGAAPVDAAAFDAMPGSDAPACTPPCFATGMSFVRPSAITFRDGILYVADADTVAAGDTNRRSGSIYAIDGFGRVTTLATAQLDVRALAVDAAGTLYWSSVGRFDPSRGEVVEAAIRRLPRGAAASTAVFDPLSSPGGGALDLVVDDTSVYFGELAAAFSVNRVLNTGGPVQELARDDLQPGHVRVQPISMAQSRERLFWLDQLGGVVTVSKTGGDAATLVPGVVTSGASAVGLGVAIDDQSFYFIRSGRAAGDDTLFAAALQGGALTPLVQQSGLLGPVIRQDANVYFRIGNDIQRAPAAGGLPIKLASEKYSSPFAVGSDYVYWASDGTVFRLPK